MGKWKLFRLIKQEKYDILSKDLLKGIYRKYSNRSPWSFILTMLSFNYIISKFDYIWIKRSIQVLCILNNLTVVKFIYRYHYNSINFLKEIFKKRKILTFIVFERNQMNWRWKENESLISVSTALPSSLSSLLYGLWEFLLLGQKMVVCFSPGRHTHPIPVTICKKTIARTRYRKDRKVEGS